MDSFNIISYFLVPQCRNSRHTYLKKLNFYHLEFFLLKIYF